MEQGLGLLESVVEVNLGKSSVPAPGLLVELPSWRQVFLRNLRDLLWKREQPPLRLASKPADFWPDVFVPSHLPWGRFLQSLAYHLAVACLAWAAMFLLPRRIPIAERPVVHRDDVIYYPVSEYLPPLNTGVTHAQLPQKGEPALAPQPIISVPPQADNSTQTIVTPPKLQLNHEVALPNVVSWAHTLIAVPIAATERVLGASKAPALNVSAVAPPPDVTTSSTRLLSEPQAAVVAPPPTVSATSARLGDINIGPATVVAPAPKLPVGEQRILAAAPAGLGNATAVPPPPSMQGGASDFADRLIALGIHPASLSEAVQAPAGNRRGRFAATPQGKADAPGTPEISGSAGKNGAGVETGPPPGLYVGAGPSDKHSNLGGNGTQAGNPATMAKIIPPRIGLIPPRQSTRELPSSRETDVEQQVFGDRKFYSMSLNVPNLNSAGGSWVIHFAELPGDQSKGDLVAPTAIAIADPAYPLELMRQNVQGTVTLYAIIRSDGTVSNVRVLRSVDDRLDQYASDALSHWQFHPATKNGSPVNLEAVVTIPFHPGRARSNF